MLRILQVSKSRVNGSLLQSIRKQHVYSEVPLPKPEKENRPLTVAIVGRPNTGKSTLFNRLTGTKMAIVSNVPGTTRDRREEKGMLAGLSLQVIDTGGLDDRGVVCEAIKQQVSEAMTSADIILFTVDARHGITPLDEHFARWIRKHLRPKGFDRNGQPLTISTGTDARASTLQDIFLVANKTEGAHLSDAVIDTVSESYRMGFGEPILISAAHGDGMADLAQVLIKAAQDRNLDDGDFYTKEKRLKLDRKALQMYIANKSGNELLDQNNQPIKKLAGGATKKMKTTGGAFANVPNAAKNKVPSGLLGNEYLDVAANAINLQNQGGEVVSGSNNLVPMTGEGTSVLPMNIALNAKGQIIRPLEERLIQLAIMGRPNVGKSTLLNSIIGSNRVITGATPGMTRDAIHVEWKFGDRNFRLVDTAGLTRMRPNKELMTGLEEKKRAKANDLQMTPEAAIKAEKKTLLTSKRGPNGTSNAITLPGIGQMDPNIDPSQFSYQISEYALISALNALRFAQVVLLVIESKQGTFNKLELQLARKCLEEGRALVICANKADMLQKDNISRDAFEASVKEHTDKFMREFGNVPIVSTSGLEGHGIRRLLDTVIATHDSWSKRVNTGLLNSWLRDMMVTSPTARLGRKRINIKYATQIKTRPPTFALFGNVTSLPGFFERFLKNRIQRDFKLEGIPVRFVVRKTVGNPVKRRLLKQGHSRRGVGHNERRGQGPTRHIKMLIQKQKGKLNVRRKRDTTKQRQRNQH